MRDKEIERLIFTWSEKKMIDGKSFDEIFASAVDLGAEDVEEMQDDVIVYTKAGELEAVKKALTDKGLTVASAEIAKKASTTVKITDPETAKKILNLMEKLEALDDVQKVFSNFDIPDNILAEIQGSL